MRHSGRDDAIRSGHGRRHRPTDCAENAGKGCWKCGRSTRRDCGAHGDAVGSRDRQVPCDCRGVGSRPQTVKRCRLVADDFAESLRLFMTQPRRVGIADDVPQHSGARDALRTPVRRCASKGAPRAFDRRHRRWWRLLCHGRCDDCARDAPVTEDAVARRRSPKAGTVIK
ncbi:hypothetical protein MTO96_035488 [Rhipicephalus appendiculatus]